MSQKIAVNQEYLKFPNFNLIIIGFIFLIYIAYLQIPIMEIDAAQYAMISLEMSQNNSYLQIYEEGKDYLDKPPLLFWLASIGIKIFGPNSIAYKIFPFIIICFGYFATFRFVALHYTKNVAFWSIIILATCQGYFLMVNDVRTDGILFGSIMLSIWQLSCYFKGRNWKYFLGAAFFASMAMMAKGPIGLLSILLPIGLDLIIRKQWKDVFHIRWLLFLGIVLVFLSPMLWGLYNQFDLHPEKTAYGIKSPSGIIFYFWTQSFGRITGGSDWNNETSYLYFFHTILWDFFPWIVVLLPALFFMVKNKAKLVEWISVTGFLMLFSLLSFSKYKLPHYIYITFPFASIICASYFTDISLKSQKLYSLISIGLLSIVGILFLAYFTLFFPFQIKNIWPVSLILLVIVLFFKVEENRHLVRFALVSISLNILLSMCFYPVLLQYQSGNQAATWISKHYDKNQLIYQYKHPSNSFSYYYGKAAIEVDSSQLADIPTSKLLLTDEKIFNPDWNLVKIFETYPVTRLNVKFLLNTSRLSELHKSYLYQKK